MIEGKMCDLPEFIQLEKVRGVERLVLVTFIDGKKNRSYHPATLEAFRKLKSDAASAKSDRKKYGAEFGTVSNEEKRAVEIWREYKRECENSGLPFVDILSVMKKGISELRTSTPTFSAMARTYVDYLIQKAGGVLTAHIDTIRNRTIKMSEVLGSCQLHKITEKDIISYINGMTTSTGAPAKQNTKNQYMSLIKSIYKHAIERNLIEENQNPTKLIKINKVLTEEPTILSVEDVRKIFDYLKSSPELHKYIPVMAIGFFGGPRVLERCRLTYADIFNGGRNEIFLSRKITKTKLDRVLYMSDNMVEWLNFAKEHGVSMRDDDYLLSGDTEQKRKDSHNRLLYTLEKATGIAFPKNCIRHSAATYMCELQGFTRTSTQLGHSEGMLQAHYRRAISKEQAEAYFNIRP